MAELDLATAMSAQRSKTNWAEATIISERCGGLRNGRACNCQTAQEKNSQSSWTEPSTRLMTTPTFGDSNLFARPGAKMAPTNLFTTQGECAKVTVPALYVAGARSGCEVSRRSAISGCWLLHNAGGHDPNSQPATKIPSLR